MKVYLPFTGEFGGELLKVVPKINGDKNPKIVFCEKGKKTLYPSANKLYEIERVPENRRGTVHSRNIDIIFKDIKKKLGPNHQFIDPLHIGSIPKWFVPKSEIDYNFSSDVVIFPRKKSYRAALNWDKWWDIVLALQAEGLSVFAIGHRDSSIKLPCRGIWDFREDSDLDVSIYALMHSKIRIGLLTALHVLSLMCGKNAIVLTTPDGKMHPKGNNKPNLSYLDFADHLKVGYEVLKSFDIKNIVNNIKARI